MPSGAFGHVLPQQAVEVLVGASLPTGKGPGKVARAAQRFINLGVPAKLFAVVIGQGLDPGLKRLKRFDDRRATKSDVLFETLAITAYPPFALHHRHDGLLVVGSNDGVAFPMTHLQALVNVRRALAQRSAVGDLSAAIPTTGVALSLLLLVTQVLPLGAAMRLVCVNMQVKRFMAHRQLASDLLRARLQ